MRAAWFSRVWLGMKVALPTWSGRISPVLDVAGQLLLVDAEQGTESERQDVAIEETDLSARAKRIADLRPDVLICGAVSRPLDAMLGSAGIRLIRHKCGSVEEVLQAFLAGSLTDSAFQMPGCCGQRGGFGRRRRCGRRGAQTKGRQT